MGILSLCLLLESGEPFFVPNRYLMEGKTSTDLRFFCPLSGLGILDWLQKWTKKKKEVYLSLVIELAFITFYDRTQASKWYDGSIGQIS